jgi:aspartyl-tRNA(Asn)/glutamyl-tRNA(Gln) amidotransferase subunit C
MTGNKKIDLDTVRHIAALAHLELTPEEEEMYTNQLEDILRYMEKLNELDTENVPPAYHTIDLKNVLREDSPTGQKLSREEAFGNAPLHDEGFFKVPKIIKSEK